LISEDKSVEELFTQLANLNYEKKCLTNFLKSYSELYSRELLSGIRKFRKYLIQCHDLRIDYEDETSPGAVISRYRTWLKGLGYASTYIHISSRTPIELLNKHGLEKLSELMWERGFYDDFQKELRERYKETSRNYRMAGYRLFQEFLIDYFPDAKIKFPEVELKERTVFEQGVSTFESYLKNERGFSDGWIAQNLRAAKHLVEFLNLKKMSSYSQLDAKLLLDFFEKRTFAKSYNVGLKNFFNFLFREGYVEKNYSSLVLTKVARENETRKFLAPDKSRDKRNYAIFLMMAKMGLRPKETLNIKLTQINWVRSRIEFTGKGSKVSFLPFPQEVGDAIIAYLKNSKRGSSGYLFLSSKPRYEQYTSVAKLNEHLKGLYLKTGIICPSKCTRLDVFRHSFATNKLRNGENMLTLRDLLRHESVDTTSIYAKYNLSSLRPLAMEWPESLSC